MFISGSIILYVLVGSYCSPADLFVGYHVDAIATVVLQNCKDYGRSIANAITEDIKASVSQLSLISVSIYRNI